MQGLFVTADGGRRVPLGNLAKIQQSGRGDDRAQGPAAPDRDLGQPHRNAGRTRLRPVLLTTLTTLGGLIPMALRIDVGSGANAPLARAVIGGLAVSLSLTPQGESA